MVCIFTFYRYIFKIILIFTFNLNIEIINIQQQPTVSHDDQPTIAIITVNYYEKLAVDAMMSNKVTFVRHKPEGLFALNIVSFLL